MPLLLYCVAAEQTAPPAGPGLRGRPIETATVAGLACFYSAGEQLPAGSPDQLRKDALDFHRVVSDVFSRTAVIPFRFPTLIEDAAELELLLQRNGPDYLESLITHRDHAQLELRLLQQPPAAREHGSGKEYLEGRQASSRALESAANSARQQLGDLAMAWHQRPSGEGLRCFALLRREAVAECRERLRKVAVPEGLKAVVSGPWPVTEFLDVVTHE